MKLPLQSVFLEPFRRDLFFRDPLHFIVVFNIYPEMPAEVPVASKIIMRLFVVTRAVVAHRGGAACCFLPLASMVFVVKRKKVQRYLLFLSFTPSLLLVNSNQLPKSNRQITVLQ